MLLESLVEFGLSEREATTYLALLELEVATVQEIAHATAINRSSMYLVLESLKQRGLVNLSQDVSGQKYIVSPPDRLLEIARSQKQRSFLLRQNIFEAVSELRSMSKKSYYTPQIEIYEGEEGILECFYRNIRENKEKILYLYSSLESLVASPIPDDALAKYEQERARLKVAYKAIVVGPTLDCPYLNEPRSLNQFAYIPESNRKYMSDFAIFDNKVHFVSYEDMTCIVITNDEIAKTIKELFELAWIEAEKVDRENAETRGVHVCPCHKYVTR